MRFVLVHHGEQAGSGSDAPLSQTGLRQARAVAGELAALGARGQRHASVLMGSSPASQSAGVLIADALDLSAEVREELISHGPSGAGADMQERAWSLIDSLKQTKPPDGTMILVADEVTIRALVCHALSLPLTETRRFALDPGSLSVIEYRTQPRERTLIASLNETCHLDDRT